MNDLFDFDNNGKLDLFEQSAKYNFINEIPSFKPTSPKKNKLTKFVEKTSLDLTPKQEKIAARIGLLIWGAFLLEALFFIIICS